MVDTPPKSAATGPAAPAAPAAARAYVFRGEGTGLFGGMFQRWSWNAGRFLSRVLSMLMFRLHVRGQADLPATGGALLVANHQSFLDPWLLGIAPARQIHYMARDTLFKRGVLGFLLELWNSFPVKRGAADLGAIRTAVERLDSGFILTIFPEGTRSEDGSIGAIAPGVALILNRVKADVPVVPTLIDGAYNAWPRKATFPRPKPIRIVYGKAIPAAEWRAMSPDEIAWRIRRELVALQEQMHSPHAADSRRRLDEDQAKAAAEPPRGKRRRDR